MNGPGPWAVALLMAITLSGCTGSAETATPEEIVVRSPPRDVHSTETQDEPPASTKEHGMIVGYVVDAAIRPISGARVSIPGLDLSDETDRDGAFAFPDLLPSAYFLVAAAPGFVGAETTVEVPEGGILQVRFVLDAIPPPTPRNVTRVFNGYTEVTGSDLLFTWCSCEFPMDVDAGARAYVVEAIMDEYQWGGTVSGNNSFSVDFRVGYDSYVYQSGPNPFRTVVTPTDFDNETNLRLRVEPHSFPMPETAKSFSVYVTVFYHGEPPEGWSFIEGDGGTPEDTQEPSGASGSPQPLPSRERGLAPRVTATLI